MNEEMKLLVAESEREGKSCPDQVSSRDSVTPVNDSEVRLPLSVKQVRVTPNSLG